MSTLVGLFFALFFGTGDLKDPFPQIGVGTPAASSTAGPTGGLRNPFCEGRCNEAELKEPFGSDSREEPTRMPTSTQLDELEDPFGSDGSEEPTRMPTPTQLDELEDPFGTEPEAGDGVLPFQETRTECSGLKNPFAEPESCIEDLREP